MRTLPNLSGLSLREAAPTGVIPSVGADDVVHANLMYQQIRDVHIWEEEAWKRLQAYADSVGLGNPLVTRPADVVGIADAIVQRSLRAGIFSPTTNAWTELYSLLTNGFTTEFVPSAYLSELEIKPLKTTYTRLIKIPFPRDWHAYYVKEFEKQLPKNIWEVNRIEDEYKMQVAAHENARPAAPPPHRPTADSDSEDGFVPSKWSPEYNKAIREWRRNAPHYPIVLKWIARRDGISPKEKIMQLQAVLAKSLTTVAEWPEWKDYQGKPSGPEPHDQLYYAKTVHTRDLLEKIEEPFTTKEFESDKLSPDEPVGPWMYKFFTACNNARAVLRNNAERYNNFISWILRASPESIQTENGLLVNDIPFDLHPLELLEMSWDAENMPVEAGSAPEKFMRDDYGEELMGNQDIRSYYETVPTLKYRNCGRDFNHWWKVPRDVNNFFRMYTDEMLRADRGAMAAMMQAMTSYEAKQEFQRALQSPDALENNIAVQHEQLQEITERNARAHRYEFRDSGYYSPGQYTDYESEQSDSD